MRWHLLLLTTALLLVPTAATAYPISAATLWTMTRDAPLIVLARVERLHAGAAAPETFATARYLLESCGGREGSGLARLHVLEVWKGETGPEIDVETDAGMICPAPPRFVPGRTVLAFLTAGSRGVFRVPYLSYGTLYPASTQVATIRSRVVEAIALNAKRPVPDAARHEWLVRCASHDVTRWDGLYELAPASDEVHAYYDSNRKKQPVTVPERDLEAIAQGFVREPSWDRAFPMTLALLKNHRSAELDRTAIAVIDAISAEADLPYWFREALALVLDRLGAPPELEKPVAESKDTEDFTDRETYQKSLAQRDQRLREHWKAAREKMKLPPSAPLKRPEGVSGVGGSTPD